MNITRQEIAPNVILLTFETQYELTMSMVRIQEFYECPSNQFQGKYFELEEYMDYWAKNFGYGAFDYPKRWNGFNVPGAVIVEWLKALAESHGALRQKELDVLNRISNHRQQKPDWWYADYPHNLEWDDIYVIACHAEYDNTYQRSDRQRVINHELAHALYTLDPVYRGKCDALLKKFARRKCTRLAKRTLKGMGYSKKTMKDELQAFWSSEPDFDYLYKDLIGKEEFHQNFEEYVEEVKRKMKAARARKRKKKASQKS